MLKSRIALAREVQDRIVAAERTNDDSLIASAQLVVALLEGSRSVNAAASVGHAAFEHVISAFSASSESRRRLIAAHEELIKVKGDIGLETIALGGGANKRPNDFSTSASLSVVGDTQAA